MSTTHFIDGGLFSGAGLSTRAGGFDPTGELEEEMMARQKVSFLFPVLSLLLFLVLSFLRCGDVAKSPLVQEVGEPSDGLQMVESPIDLDDDFFLKTKQGDFLIKSDVRVIPSRMDQTESSSLWMDIPDPGMFLFDFGPEGTKFRRPCRIEVSLQKADATDADVRKIRVYYIDGDRLQRVPSMVNHKNGRLVFWVKHFSRYALSRE